VTVRSNSRVRSYAIRTQAELPGDAGGPGSIRNCGPGGWIMPKVFKFRKYAPTQDD
jgi:hypothetical protein